MLITCDKYGPIQLQRSPASDYLGLPGLTNAKANLPFIDVFQQSVEGNDYNIFYLSIRAHEPIDIMLSPATKSDIKLFLSMQAQARVQLNLQAHILQKDQYILSGSDAKEILIHCTPHQNYTFYCLHFKPEFIYTITYANINTRHFLKDQVDHLNNGNSFIGYVSNNIFQLIQAITHKKMPVPLVVPYLDIKLTEFLLEVFAQLFTRANPPSHLQLFDNIYQDVHDFILNNIDQHLTIPQLAKQFQLNELYLKSGFKNRYGLGLYEFLQQERMNYARYLLLNTQMPIKEISSKVGFDFTSNFTTAFNLHFGYTPGSTRRKK